MPPRSRLVTLLALAAVSMTALVTGCGSATSGASLAGSTAVASVAASPVPPVPAAATPSPTAARPAPTHRATAEASGLPWPTATAAGAADLQKAVDGGSQPWLLDPAEVAESYAASKGWTGVQTSGGGAHVTVRSSAGTHTLTLAQPGRKGQGGIWLVTTDSAG